MSVNELRNSSIDMAVKN